jgi:PAS domain S-box-containing protein
LEEQRDTIKGLGASWNFLQSVLDGMPDLINIVDKDFQIIFVNEAAANQARQPKAQLIGKKCYKELWRRDENCPNCVTEKTFETGLRHQSVDWETLPNGNKCCLERSTFPITDGNGEIICAVEIAKDATERKKSEEEREEQRMELGSRIRELRHAYEELESLHSQLLQAEKMSSLGQMASSLAHELDSPLTVISGHCELLSHDFKDNKTPVRLNTIAEQVARCQKTIRNMLDFSRESKGEKKPHGIETLINQTMSLMQHIMKVRKIKVNRNLDKSIPNIFVDGNQLQQVFFNLLKNATDAMPRGGEIFITSNYHTGPGVVEIAFQDTGIGISEDNLKNIFKPFFTMKEPGKGTGLGLTICLDIIKNHGGTITAESVVGKGSKFVVTLPAERK